MFVVEHIIGGLLYCAVTSSINEVIFTERTADATANVFEMSV